MNGGWGEWQAWSECSSSCAGGVRYRYRFCDDPTPSRNGQMCVGAGSVEEECGVTCAGKTRVVVTRLHVNYTWIERYLFRSY